VGWGGWDREVQGMSRSGLGRWKITALGYGQSVSSALSTVRETPFLLPGPGLFLEALEG
jgi:hypothetical protein